MWVYSTNQWAHLDDGPHPKQYPLAGMFALLFKMKQFLASLMQY
ncbi:hypothetical protein KIPB_015891, partial [Kipferlia bialata]|eukprot:g15891.t1